MCRQNGQFIVSDQPTWHAEEEHTNSNKLSMPVVLVLCLQLIATQAWTRSIAPYHLYPIFPNNSSLKTPNSCICSPACSQEATNSPLIWHLDFSLTRWVLLLEVLAHLDLIHSKYIYHECKQINLQFFCEYINLWHNHLTLLFFNEEPYEYNLI